MTISQFRVSENAGKGQWPSVVATFLVAVGAVERSDVVSNGGLRDGEIFTEEQSGVTWFPLVWVQRYVPIFFGKLFHNFPKTKLRPFSSYFGDVLAAFAGHVEDLLYLIFNLHTDRTPAGLPLGMVFSWRLPL